MTMAYRMLVRSFFPTGLLENTMQCSRWYLVAGLTGDGYTARFTGMLELSMAPFCCDKEPTVFFQLIQYFANLHVASIAQF